MSDSDFGISIYNPNCNTKETLGKKKVAWYFAYKAKQEKSRMSF